MMSILLKFRKEGVNMPNCLTHVFCFVLFLIHSNVSDVNNVYFFGPQTPMCLRISWYAYEKQIVGLHPHGVRRSIVIKAQAVRIIIPIGQLKKPRLMEM